MTTGQHLKRATPFAVALGIWFFPVPPGLTAPAWHLFAVFAAAITSVLIGAFPLLTWNGPSWSISCEFWTYILFGAVVLAVGRSMAIFGALALAAGAALFVLDPPTMNVT